jgi:translocator protein
MRRDSPWCAAPTAAVVLAFCYTRPETTPVRFSLYMRDRAALGIFVALVILTALFGSQFQPGPWYEALEKPPLNPPSWAFAPVWSVLYLAIAVAGWLVWRARPASATPLALWGAQLALNGAWSLLFFGLHLPGLALIEIVLLLALLIATAALFFRVRTLAGVLFLPYVAWVSFAAYLNAGLWYLNR